MSEALTARDLANELLTVTSSSDARAVVNRATRIVGVPDDRPLQMRELLQMCEAMAAEGGLVQEVAELIARRALADD